MGVQTNHIATNINLESIGGVQVRPNSITTAATNPSPGQTTSAPPNVTRLIGVDYQISSSTVNIVSGQLLLWSWPTVSFSGLLSSAQRYKTGVNATNGILPITIGTANNTPLVAGQSTQLLLICTAQMMPLGIGGVISPPNFVVKATTTSSVTPQITGPWFPTGVTYTSFSCVANVEYLPVLTASNVLVNIGIAAQLYSVYVQ
jgi:hypothetical protein